MYRLVQKTLDLIRGTCEVVYSEIVLCGDFQPTEITTNVSLGVEPDFVLGEEISAEKLEKRISDYARRAPQSFALKEIETESVCTEPLTSEDDCRVQK